MSEADPTAPPAASRRWVRAFLGTLFVALLAIGGLNFVVNPYGYYPTRTFPPLTWSSRETKVHLLERAGAPDILVLGSSRAMKVPPREIERITGRRAFNAAVDSARVEDWWAIYGFVRQDLGYQVKELVLGIDIEAFHDHIAADERLLASSELRRQLPWDMRLEWMGGFVPSLLSYAQAFDSVRSLQIARHGYPAPHILFDDDGFQHDVEVEQKIANGTFRLNLSDQVAAYQARFANFDDLSGQRKRLFEELLDRTTKDNVRVRSFVTPLHAQLIATLRQTRDFDRLRAKLVGYLHDLEARYPLFSATDFTETEAFGGDPERFLDPAHTDDENARRMTAALWGAHAVQ